MATGRESAARCVVEVIPLVMRTLALEMRSTGYLPMPAHCRLLLLLAERPHNLSELAERQAVTLPTMSNSISTLVERGLATRLRAPHDRRMVLVELTPDGRAVLRKMVHSVEGRIAERLGCLSSDQDSQIIAGLEALRSCFARTAECSRQPARQTRPDAQDQNASVGQGDLCPPTTTDILE